MNDRQINASRMNFVKSSTSISIIGLLLFSFLIMPIDLVFQKDGFIGLQFVFIAILSVVALLKENEVRPFSISMSFFFFCYLFFYCAGVYQVANETYRWYLHPTSNEVMQANFIVILGLISFSVGHFFHFKTRNSDFIQEKYKIRKWGLCFLLLLLLGYLGYLFTFMSISSFFLRATFYSNNSGNQAIGLLIASFRNGVALVCSLSFIQLYKEKRSKLRLIGMITSLVVSLFVIPPTAVARFLAGSFYGAIVLYSFPVFKKGRSFLFLMFFFILMVFPFLNNFRFQNGNIISIFDIVSGLSRNFQAADFDAYTMVIYTVQYVSDFGYSLGHQLSGAIGFFIPRAIWETKPIGTGNLIIDSLLVPVNGNVSAPLFAEFYINFSYFGVVFFSIIIGCLFHTLDLLYWKNSNRTGYYGIIYPFLSLIIIFICRGDLMSTGAFCFGLIITAFLAFKLVYKAQ